MVAASRQPALVALFTAAFALVYLPAIELEEQHLRNLFPEYEEYARRVPRLGFRISGQGSAETFRIALYRRNEEYKAAVGFVLVMMLLIWKTFMSRF